ncbi:MAG: pirin family protein [Candidatus Poribacteria bacterium]|nr:pirin family protein [Candidatus Poribacteria bacterium]
MNKIVHRSIDRGFSNLGWLESYHSFSFADYVDLDKMHFGALRVLNDDRVDAGKGFSMHSHQNMEIISIPLSGGLEHQDNMGNRSIIQQGDVQVMSAGKGIFHSEYNKNQNREVQFLQIWVIPNKKDVVPRYDQISIIDLQIKNQLYQILSPIPEDDGTWIHQEAWFYLGEFDRDKKQTYEIKKTGNGVYVFVLEGEIKISGEKINQRDAIGIWNTSSIEISAETDSRLLVIDVPMID